MNTVKRKTFNKVATLALAVIMVLSLGVAAFAATGEKATLETNLYKSGKFDPAKPGENLSMGNGAVKDSTYEKRSDGRYNVTIKFLPEFKAKGMKGHLTKVEVDVNGDGNYENDGVEMIPQGKSIVGVKFVQDSIPTSPKLLNGKFTINIGIMPVGAKGDLVIFPAK